ncbi:hypothetical protein [uncultured Prevotella sp.]|uniref:hypothetical protein n=1 Tax=uncultured Prevotella sp. TaxID=159272 RepID=UPI00258EC8CF|nr:hypothetical protein [uncultured Prevotella sp.]
MKKIDDILNGLQGQQPDVSNPDEWTDRIMDSLPDLPTEQPKPARRIRLYVASAITVAASVLLLLTLHRNDVDPQQVQSLVTQQIEQKDSSLKAEIKEPKIMIAQEKPVTDKARSAIQRRTATVIAHKVSTTIPATDSLDYYIDKIERELAQVDESLYIERMNKVIRADERLQRIVNSYILHTLDKEGRPQTADNMYNVKTEEDEE